MSDGKPSVTPAVMSSGVITSLPDVPMMLAMSRSPPTRLRKGVVARVTSPAKMYSAKIFLTRQH